MRINVCINGTFRYPDYIRFYESAGCLQQFYFAHRRGRTGATLGLPGRAAHNLWPKHYAAAALFRMAPDIWAPVLTGIACDAWQRAVIGRWAACDSMEAVIGAVADRIIAHARREGTRVLGHPVTTHPGTMRMLVDRARDDVGLPPVRPRPSDMDRRRDEIAGCDALLVDSPFVARSFTDHGWPAERLAVVRPALDYRRFYPRAPGERDRQCFTVVCVGTITPRKAQQVLLRAWAKLRLPKARLLLVGPRGPGATAVLDGHTGHFTHIPYLDHGALPALLVRASCFVLVSAEDGFAQAPLEAMACGVPVILSDTVGAASLIVPGRNGFVVPPFDPDALAAVLERLYLDPDLVDSIGATAAATVQASGTWPDYVEQVLALHRQLVDRGDLATPRAA